jgi:tetratricopeptide (TPR) repeat protein
VFLGHAQVVAVAFPTFVVDDGARGEIGRAGLELGAFCRITTLGLHHMQAKTIKRLAILIAILGLISGTGFIGQRWQVARLATGVLGEAAIAEKEGNYNKAENLYWQHLEIFKDDVDVQIKHADAHLKVAKTYTRQAEAQRIYAGIVRRDPSHEGARRRLMELEMDMGSPADFADARTHLAILLKKAGRDGDLMFKSGRCCEAAGDEKEAVKFYREAIAHSAPRPNEVYQRLAVVLRDRLGQEKEADEAIKEMVRSDPKNYKVYLAHGNYLLSHPDLIKRKQSLANARDDFQQALKLAPGEPEIYLDIAKVADGESGSALAQQILRDGLKASPTSELLYEALANSELRTDQTDAAINTLERGLKSCPADPQGRLHWILANVLAVRKDAGKLLLQIEELKKIGFPAGLVQYLNAYYYINIGDYVRARQLLVPLQATMKRSPDLKARVNVLLARCHSQLVEPEMEREAYLRAVSANPHDLSARQGWINGMINQGDLEGAIREYRALVKQVPQLRLALVRLLIVTNRQRLAAERNWSEVEGLLTDAAKAMPESAEPVILTAEMRMAQGNSAEARKELEKAIATPQFSKNVELRVAQASIVGLDGRFEDALKLLDGAQQQLGDRVEFRLQRAKLWSQSPTPKGPAVVSVLSDLGKNLGPFSADDRRKLLTGLAAEHLRQQDLPGASRLWTQLAEQDPKNLETRLTLLDLAFQIPDEDEIRTNIKRIEEIDGSDGVLGRYCQVRYLIWQADRASDKNKQVIYRDTARAQLNDLLSRRGDWSVIPLALAQIEEQELAQAELTQDERRAKEESIATHYLRAVRLGQRQPAVVRRAMQLLFKTRRGVDALELVNIPMASQLAGDVGRQAVQFALQNRDFQRAEEIARKTVAANPGDFQERLWLVRVLLESGRQAQAETALREAVALSKSDPDRWISLILFMIVTKQPEQAELAIRDAEGSLPKARVALTLAQGCELIGRFYDQATREEDAKKWYSESAQWYRKAQTDQPDDNSIVRRRTEFYLRTKQMDEAELLLTDVLKAGAERKNADAYAWAKRTLALAYASGPGVDRTRKALALFESTGEAAPAGQEGKTLTDPEDLRILARVLDAQKNADQVKRAREILESLIDKNTANNEDRFLLARLYEKSGDWHKAREEYRGLNFRTKNARDLESLNRRPVYLAQIIESLLRNRPDAKDLNEAQDLMDELQQLQPQALATVALQVELYQAQNQFKKAADLIKDTAARPNPTPAALAALANLAEKHNELGLAERVYVQLSELPTVPRGKLILARFLGRHHKVGQALDVCEKLWATTREPEVLTATCIEVLYSDEKAEPAHLERVSGRVEQALAKPGTLTAKTKHLLLIGLGNVRERQGKFPEAEALYKRAIEEGDLDGTSRNNLAWLMALKNGKGAGKAALDYINDAIKLSGPRADYFDTRGIIRLKNGETQLAIDDLEKAVALDPSAPKYFHLAQAYHEIKDKEKTRENLEKAKNKGLTPSGLHPLEHPDYDRLITEMAKP